MNLVNAFNVIKEASLENIWPTRCCICDKPGYLLCPNCMQNIHFVDINKTCKVCGEPYGANQCCNCSPIDKSLTEEEKENYKNNFSECIGVTLLDENTGRIITIYKDAGERRLAHVIAYFLNKYIPKEWKANKPLLTYIPSTEDAIKRRGFDHAELLCKSLSNISKIPYKSLFIKPKTSDQRQLNRKERNQNIANKFLTINYCNIKEYNSVILIDDVFTTGATIRAGTDAILKTGIKKVNCLIFSRTF